MAEEERPVFTFFYSFIVWGDCGQQWPNESTFHWSVEPENYRSSSLANNNTWKCNLRCTFFSFRKNKSLYSLDSYSIPISYTISKRIDDNIKCARVRAKTIRPKLFNYFQLQFSFTLAWLVFFGLVVDMEISMMMSLLWACTWMSCVFNRKSRILFDVCKRANDLLSR